MWRPSQKLIDWIINRPQPKSTRRTFFDEDFEDKLIRLAFRCEPDDIHKSKLAQRLMADLEFDTGTIANEPKILKFEKLKIDTKECYWNAVRRGEWHRDAIKNDPITRRFAAFRYLFKYYTPIV
ncbi:MAG: hypothetical protein DRJ64_05065, partial [Thermoprotei archaeon]